MNLYGQIRRVETDKKIFDYKDLDIDFTIKKDNTTKTNTATVSIYNLSEASIDSLKVGGNITILDGYESHYGVSFIGTIDSVLTYQDRQDLVTEIIATTSNQKMMNMYFSQTFQAGKKASEILALLNTDKNKNPFTVEFVVGDLPRDPVYTHGKSFSTALQEVFKILANDTGCKMNFDNEKVYLTPPGKTYEKTFKISAANGLLKIEPAKEGYLMQALMIPGIKENVLVDVDSKRHKGLYRVKEVTRIASGQDDFSIYAQLMKEEGA